MNTSKSLLAISACLFIGALSQDAYYIEGDDPRAWASAWGLLLIGWIGLFNGVFSWLANPALIIGWSFSLSGNPRTGLWMGIVALLFMLSFLLHTSVISSEAPTYSKITGHGLGYWLWVASAITLCLSNIKTALTYRSSK